MSPYELGIMLHYYAHVDDHESVIRNPPIWGETCSRFQDNDLIECVPREEVKDAVYRITSRGRAFVEALEDVPLPSQRWVVEWPTTR